MTEPDKQPDLPTRWFYNRLEKILFLALLPLLVICTIGLILSTASIVGRLVISVAAPLLVVYALQANYRRNVALANATSKHRRESSS